MLKKIENGLILNKGGIDVADFQELEVKILGVDIERIKERLKEINAQLKKECLQKIYTYDCYSSNMLYNLALNDYQMTKSKNSLLKISNIYSQIEPVVSDTEKIEIKKICGYETISEYILNNTEDVDIGVLKNEIILKIIKETEERFFKWIRLRKNGEKNELTVKYIYNTNSEYDIEQVKEVEINVSDFEVANKIVEEMGYYRKKLVEKKRTSYVYKNVKIEIDEWPLIEPYIEIEGETKEEIYNVVNEIGYTKEDCKVMNTDDVYLMQGIDLNSFEVLTFDEQKLI